MHPRSSHRALGSHPITPFAQNQPLQFELIEKNDLLQYSLASSVNAVINAWHLATSYLGLIPPNSVADKFPYYRHAAGNPSVTQLPRRISWVFNTRKNIEQQQKTPTKSSSAPAPALRRGKKSFSRDGLTKPGMVLFYNIVLAWAMFQVDVSAARF